MRPQESKGAPEGMTRGDAVPNYTSRIHGGAPQEGTSINRNGRTRAWCDTCGMRIQLDADGRRWSHV